MTEILTESFCERCGTRYTFESAGPRTSRVGRVRVLSKGLRNYVLADGTTLNEAMADARSEVEVAATAHQLDAFHKTFNFCLSCRQYTCGNCWNEAEGRCLGCAPIPGMEVEAEAAGEAPQEPAVVDTLVVGAVAVEAAEEASTEALDPWPEADLGRRLSAFAGAGAIAAAVGSAESAKIADTADTTEIADVIEPTAVPEVAGVIGVAPGQSIEDALAAYEAELDAEADATAEAEALVAAEDEFSELAHAAETAEPAPVALAVEPELAAEPALAVEPDAVDVAAVAALAVVADGADTDLAAEPASTVEPDAVDVAAVAAVAAVVIGAAESNLEPEAEPDPVAVTSEAQAEPDALGTAAATTIAAVTIGAAGPEPEPVAAETEPEPGEVAAEPGPEPVAAEADAEPVDVIAQPTWPVVTPPAVDPVPPDAPAPEPVQPAWLTVAPDDGAAPQWPTSPAWNARPAGRPGVQPTLAGRPLLPQGDAAAMWAASAHEVLSGGPSKGKAQPAAAAPTAQPCISCGLSLSANARFCRRCGSRQG